MVSPVLQLHNIASRKLAAIKRKATRLGVTPEAYVKQLIEQDLVLDQVARDTFFDVLAAPFRNAMKGISEGDLDKLVDKARGPRRRPAKR